MKLLTNKKFLLALAAVLIGAVIYYLHTKSVVKKGQEKSDAIGANLTIQLSKNDNLNG